MFSYNYQNLYEIGISQFRRLKFIFLLICFTTKKQQRSVFGKCHIKKKNRQYCVLKKSFNVDRKKTNLLFKQ